MRKSADVEVNGQKYRLLPISALDGAYLLKLLMSTEVALRYEGDRTYKGPKGRVLTREENREVQMMCLAQCLRVDRMPNGVEALEPIITTDGAIVGNVDHGTIFKLVEEAKKVLIYDPLFAEEKAQLPAEA